MKVTGVSVVELPNGRWRGTVIFGKQGSIEAVKDTFWQALTFCKTLAEKCV